MRFCNLHSCVRFCILSALLFFVPGCGEESDMRDFVVAGTLAVDESMRYGDAPVIVAVTKSLDAGEIQEDPDAAIIKYVAAGENGATFEIDLSDTALMPGDTINLIAFVDNNYTGGCRFRTRATSSASMRNPAGSPRGLNCKTAAIAGYILTLPGRCLILRHPFPAR